MGKKLAKDKGGSMRWGSFRKTKEVVEGIFDFSSYPVVDSGGGGDTKMKITRVKKRSGSFSNLSHTKPHFLANIYEGLKQAVPWRRRQERLRKRHSHSVTF